MKTLTYFACAQMPDGRLGQLLVSRTVSAPGVCVAKSQEWTGVVYRSMPAALKDLERLNCGGAK